ncbi:MAG: thermonuclease family protein [Phycisphaerae bacterium]|nr:MAG: hypothetical protein EDS66_05640 [Planctomycetota bacterium]KAB2946378.1 MAG: hypothetical protein F9K17_08590 [Phycisphaerae bacterium]MBE7457271.1 thermonuclease family protein [Planctomycetia bacterium]MCK6465487.1 thermonuclease family protein [Phycisphaerae bacterium]MCL4719120.1 thermonuclease family protein [Phycisphaerae bacterium]
MLPALEVNRPIRRTWRFHLRLPWVRAVAFLLAVSAAGAVWRGFSDPQRGDDVRRYHGCTFRVVNVVDGDTFDLAVPDGEHPVTRVRLWGVDTPEVAGSRDGAMHFGAEASVFAKSALRDREVYVVLDPLKTRDFYGRLLAYVHPARGEPSFNETLVVTGHAYADLRFDHAYAARFEALEKDARARRAGLWADLTPERLPAWRQRIDSRR